jgi:diguanylate cyclase (GGDEF)-like protein
VTRVADRNTVVLLRRIWPNTALATVRFAALIFACVSIVPSLPANLGLGVSWRLAGSAGIVLLVMVYVTVFLRRRTFLVEPAVVAALLVVIGSSREDPEAIIGLSMGALTLLSMHSTFGLAIARVALIVVAMLSSIAISPAAQAAGLAWRAEQNVALVPILTMMALLNTAMNVLLQRQQRAAAREALLAEAGLGLVNVTDLHEVRRVVGDALHALCAQWPGHPVLVVRRAPESAVDEIALGTTPGLAGVTMPAEVVSGLPDTMTLLDDDRQAALHALAGGAHTWHGMGIADERHGLLVLVAGRRIPPALCDGLRAMATYWSLAETNCRVHAELGRQADSDQLTSLYNRRGFLQLLAAARRSAEGASVDALLMVDLDDFKHVNDSYGHAAGDGLLMEIADRIARAAGPAGWPARLGGDEFVVLLTGLPDVEAADRAAERLREDLLQPVHLTEATVSVGASIGIAIATPELTAGDLMRCADIAMYSAKAKGKNRVERFTPERHGSIERIRRLEEHLAHAVARNEIRVHYQPRIDIATGRCIGMEALTRWHDQVIGTVEPATFIPLAVRTGQIKELGAHVVRTACEQLSVWRRHADLRELTMSVNMAAPQLYDSASVDVIHNALRDTGVPADRLILDLTGEPAIDVDRAVGTLTALADLGVRIALDDFGAGSLSVTALRVIPVHQVKIDGSLIAERHPADDAMVQIIVALSDAMGIETVAECVETVEQAEAMRHAGVTAAQGFLFARPMAAEDATAWLAHHSLGAAPSLATPREANVNLPGAPG